MHADNPAVRRVDEGSASNDDYSPAETQAYLPISPFLPEASYAAENLPTGGSLNALRGEHYGNSSGSFALDSPFISEYSLPELSLESAESLQYREILHDIVDQEFNDALNDLVSELREVGESRFEGESFESSLEAERFLGSYLQPLQESIEQTLDQMIADSAQFENEAVTEVQIDNFFEGYNYEQNYVDPQFEDFFKKLFRKVKKIAKKGARVVKKVGKTLSKFSPVHLVLRKIKKLVRPLLKRVLKYALNKIPSRYRPLAKKLAKRFLKGRLREAENDQGFNDVALLEDQVTLQAALAMDQDMANISSESIVADFDAMMAGYLMEGEDFEHDPAAVEYFSDEQYQGVGSIDDLELARNEFINAMLELEDGDDPQVPIENFVTAILGALKIGLKLIGRKRVVNFLAKLVAKIIRRFVGPQAAKPLSRALVDAGLKLVNLENEGEQHYAAVESLAATVEEAVENLAAMAPAEAFENEGELAVYAHEAIEKAVVENFPPSLVREELRVRKTDNGVWVLRPRGKRRKKYKKYTRPISVNITPRIAAKVRTFGGRRLIGFLKEQLGLNVEQQPVQATLHMFKAMRGTSLPTVSRHEQEIQGLGSSERSAWMQFHPMTDEAAGLLAPDHFSSESEHTTRHLIDRDRIAVGQKLYYLEIPGARVMTVSQPQEASVASKHIPVRVSETNVSLDFSANQVSISSYLSEAMSTDIAGHLRNGKSASDVIGEIRKSLDADLPEILHKATAPAIQIRRASQSNNTLLSTVVPMLKAHGRVLGKMIVRFVVKNMVNHIGDKEQEFSSQFLQAANDPSDGVTLKLELTQMDDLFALLSGSAKTRDQALQKLLEGGLSGSFSMIILPGYQRL